MVDICPGEVGAKNAPDTESSSRNSREILSSRKKPVSWSAHSSKLCRCSIVGICLLACSLLLVVLSPSDLQTSSLSLLGDTFSNAVVAIILCSTEVERAAVLMDQLSQARAVFCKSLKAAQCT